MPPGHILNGKPVLVDRFGRPIRSDGDSHPEAAGMALPGVMTFIGRQGGSYNTWLHTQFDEAMRHGRDDALEMERDCHLMSLMQERMLSVVGLKWHLEVPDEKDKHQVRVKDVTTRLIKGVPSLRRMFWWWLTALWFGRSAVQVAWDWCEVRGQQKPDKADAAKQDDPAGAGGMGGLAALMGGQPPGGVAPGAGGPLPMARDQTRVLRYLQQAERADRAERLHLVNGKQKKRHRVSCSPDDDGDIRGLTISEAWPVNGDKIGHQFDNTPYILIDAAHADEIPHADIIQTTVSTALALRGTWRERFIFHSHLMEDSDYFHQESGEAIHGVGIRSKVFWLNWLKKEWLGNVTDFFDRVGLGLTLWKYPLGNEAARQAMIKAAKDQSNRAHLFVPVSPEGGKDAGTSVERVEPPTAGADALLKLVEYADTAIERYIVGQEGSASATSSSGHSNQASSQFQQETKLKISINDACMLADSLSGTPRSPALCNTIVRYTFPWADFPVQFVFDVESQESNEKLQGIKSLVDLGVKVKADDARAAAGISKPADGDELIEPPQQQQPGAPGGAPPGGGNPLEALMGGGGAGGAPPGPGAEPPQGGSQQAPGTAPTPEGAEGGGDFLDSLRGGPEAADVSPDEKAEGDFLDALRNRKIGRAVKYAWQQKEQVGKLHSGEPIYRWHDPVTGKTRDQHVMPGTGRAGVTAVTPVTMPKGKKAAPVKIGNISSDMMEAGKVRGGSLDFGEIKYDDSKFKLPYKTGMKVRLNQLADVLGDRLDDLLIDFERGDSTDEETRTAINVLVGKATSFARDVVDKRANKMARWALDEAGPAFKQTPQWKQFRNKTVKYSFEMSKVVSNLSEVCKDRTGDEYSMRPDASDRLKVAVAEMRKTAEHVAGMIGFEGVKLRDTVAAFRKTADDEVVTPSLSEEDAVFFPSEDAVRSTPKEESHLYEDELPEGLQPVLAKDDGYVLAQGEDYMPIKDKQVDAIHQYTQGGYRMLNGYLRANDGKKLPKEAKERHKQIQSVFKMLKTSETPVTVYRGLNLDPQEAANLLLRLKESSEQGKPIRFAGYSSTTFDPSIAFLYGDRGKDSVAGGAGNDVVFEISARRGLNVGALSKERQIKSGAKKEKGWFSEQELLLDHDTQFKVAGIRRIQFLNPHTGKNEDRMVVQLIQEVE